MARSRRPPSRIRTASGLLLVMAVASVAMGSGAPMALVVLAASGIGSTLLMSQRGKRQRQGPRVTRREEMDRFPLGAAAGRTRTGGMFQMKFSSSARAVCASGVLCVDVLVGTFVPSKASEAHTRWGRTGGSGRGHQDHLAAVHGPPPGPAGGRS